MRNICEGCYTYDRAEKECIVLKGGRQNECPCPICLIKVMCERSCEEMSTLSVGVFEFDKMEDVNLSVEEK
jgi:hypothetical protein